MIIVPTRRTGLRARTLPVALAVALLTGCPWFTDFKETPMVSTWESESDTVPFRGQPQHSVPINGTMAAGFQYSYAALPATIDSMSGLVNPVPADERSLANGRKYYQINCAVCHGADGNGMGPATKYGMYPFPLTGDITKGRSDGYIWAMMRNGRGAMPTYNRITEMERWDVVNYVRGLQGRLGTPVPATPVGRPGETGNTLPGANEFGPSRSFPYTHVSGRVIGTARTDDALRDRRETNDSLGAATGQGGNPAQHPGTQGGTQRGAPQAATPAARGDTARRTP